MSPHLHVATFTYFLHKFTETIYFISHQLQQARNIRNEKKTHKIQCKNTEHAHTRAHTHACTYKDYDKLQLYRLTIDLAS